MRRDRFEPFPDYDPDLLAAVAAGDAALAQLSTIEVRPVWGDDDLEAHCILCDQEKPHTRQTHMLLLRDKQRRLPRGHHASKIRQAELAWKRATGQALSMERILGQEMRDKQPPTSAKDLSEVLGVSHLTVVSWARRLGIPVQSRTDWRESRASGEPGAL
jgi:hypothetical protein